ncbi:response regulator [Croceibacter atlanticus]|jgi:CheY-like chemotaxis protein|uniref:Response regulator receiver domain protein (CheY) n=1 Tax=Croceibacter atlanticus (strain ATCC BAA-628 / JCM 21780 / CIP 108009 / IAM 15332 / KCTC 12090 / HTCC2559) TaxID=216432 RepID=A3UA29_CROAH|nr:response regulator [Croceibacter atlanticus]EAP86665.1 Response regulator receiver domain protein (CheY) [Croceibacter atlanticus HTCC2559]
MIQELSILFIEDDIVETMKMNRTINKLEVPYKIQEAKNGEQALDILNKGGELPDLILLDLNMPKINGLEFLRILKDDERLKYIPTIVLTTSNNRKDVLECYRIGIAGYILKPLKYEDYVSKIHKVLAYWSINELIKP